MVSDNPVIPPLPSIELTVIVAKFAVRPGSLNIIVSLTAYPDPAVPILTVSVGGERLFVEVENFAPVPDPEVLTGRTVFVCTS